MEIDSTKMTLPLTPEKIQRVIKTFQNLFRSSTTVVELKNSSNSFITIPELNPFIHYTNSGTCRDSVTIFSATTNCVSKEKKKKNYQSVKTLNTKSRTKLTWWIENLRFCNGRTFS